jgi:hypothetical protein
MDYSLGATLFLSGLYGGGCTMLLLWKKCTNALWSVRDIESLENYGLLFLLLIIPGSVLGLIEYVLRSPFVGSMYFMSDSISLYIFAALLIGKIPSFFGRTNIIVCIVILFAYQLCILLPHNTRTDYIGAAKLIRENATSNDSVMCLQWLAPENSLEYYLKDLQTPVKRITTLQGACDNAYEYFQLLSPTERSLHSVWCIIPFYFFQLIHSEEFARKSIENGLHERGLAYKTFLFPGHFNLVAYRINFAENISSPRHFKPVAMPFRFDEKRLINDLQISFNSQEQQEQTIYSLRHHLLSWPPIGSFIPFMDTLDLIDSGRFSLAKLMSNYTLNNSPNFGLAHYASGLVSIALKNKREASISFTRAYELHDGLQQLLGPATEDLLNGRITNALEHITLLEKQGDLYILRPLRSICGNMSK